MNAEHLKKNVGERLRLWPRPQQVENFESGSIADVVLTSGGPRYERRAMPAEYDWAVEDVGPKTVTLSCRASFCIRHWRAR